MNNNTDYITDFVPVTDEKIQSGVFSRRSGGGGSGVANTKRTKKKCIPNFKKIRLLTNVLDECDEDDGNVSSGDVDGVPGDRYSSGGGADGGDLKEGFTTEGMTENITIESFDIYQYMVEFVNYVHNGILYCMYQFSYHITKLLSLGDFEEEDVKILEKYIAWSISICVSCFCVYSWFYVMFYRSSTDEKVHSMVSDITRRKLEEYSSIYPVVHLFEPFITFSVFFPEFVQKTFINTIPNFVSERFSAAFLFCFLFYFLIYFFYNFSQYFYKLIIDILDVNTGNIWVDIIYVVVVVLFIIRWMKSVVIDFLSAGKTAEKGLNNALSKIPYVQIFYYIMYLIYFIIVMMITPFFGGVLAISVLVFISFFSMGFSVYDIIIKVNEYANKTVKEIKKDAYCAPLTLWEKIMNIINTIFDYVYKYVFYSAFIFMVLWSFNDYTNNIKSDYLKLSLIIINTLIIFVVGVIFYVDYLNNNPSEEQMFGGGGGGDGGGCSDVGYVI